ncbi:hypothetical protein [Cryobacterium tagatosivorans]|uniref:Uncharacterized protein n=1 Tax=Cryobacterium tagatosivorans TaxID=1259199 RepID=A0A4R8UCB5_9MICO|nr:hypothetical protein [Cryobacterium tagatosivorans]TFB48143.1 hypothetical protein E3O23_13945 [Cryobacterium tagatosivorans]
MGEVRRDRRGDRREICVLSSRRILSWNVVEFVCVKRNGLLVETDRRQYRYVLTKQERIEFLRLQEENAILGIPMQVKSPTVWNATRWTGVCGTRPGSLADPAAAGS